MHAIPTGYLHAQYAASLGEFGVPRELPRSGGWILERAVSYVPFRDAMGCYPLFACRDWSQLAADLEDAAAGLVCLSVVTDPFGGYDPDLLHACFPDKVMPFKEHFCIDLACPMEKHITHEHRRNARRALKRLRVEQCEDVQASLEDWTQLYGYLIRRRGITGIRAFSRSAFACQFTVPGFVAFRASHQSTTVGMSLLYVQNDVAYHHLTACNEVGYRMDSASALYWRAIEYCHGRALRWFDLGAGPGLGTPSGDGVSRFKQGWSTGTRTAHFCGRIFDHSAYDRILRRGALLDPAYFPAYRAGEFR